MISIVATGDSLATLRLSVFDEEQYRAMLQILRSGDIAFTNLEMLLGNFESAPAAESGGTYVMGEPFMAEELKWMGFNLYSRANNHSLDFGEGGLFSTSRILDHLRLVHAGVGENLARARAPAYLETKNGRVAMVSTSSTFASFGRAGETRRDLIGRPGLNPLRYQTKLILPFKLMRQLRQAFKEAGVPFRKEKDGAISLMNLRFAGGTRPEVVTSPNEADLKGIIVSIKDAKRQADYVLVSLHAHEARGSDRERPAEFLEVFSRKCIDAGASAVIGHGPHLLRGIEIYKKRPIMYSLGNFIFMNETVRYQPSENFEKFGLPWDASPADFFDARARRGRKPEGGHKWFTYDTVFWESAIAKMTWEGNAIGELLLYPLTLGFEKPRSQRGRPTLAEGRHAKIVLERIRKLSLSYGTRMDIVDGVGKIAL